LDTECKRLIARHALPSVVRQRVNSTVGRNVVLLLYLAIVGVAGVFGALIGLVTPRTMDGGPLPLEPELFGLIPLPPTPLGMAVYGMGTVGVALGAFLLLMTYVSRRYDDEAVEE
jgi:hypothetical protein